MLGIIEYIDQVPLSLIFEGVYVCHKIMKIRYQQVDDNPINVTVLSKRFFPICQSVRCLRNKETSYIGVKKRMSSFSNLTRPLGKCCVVQR